MRHSSKKDFGYYARAISPFFQKQPDNEILQMFGIENYANIKDDFEKMKNTLPDNSYLDPNLIEYRRFVKLCFGIDVVAESNSLYQRLEKCLGYLGIQNYEMTLERPLIKIISRSDKDRKRKYIKI